MYRKCVGALGAILLCTAVAQAQAVDVTTSIDAPFVGGKYVTELGETYTLSVYGQLKSGFDDPGNGIFSWDVDLGVSDTNVLSLLTGTVDRSGWTNNPLTSSDGTPVAGGLDAIYDTGETDDTLGVSSPAQLFTIDFTTDNLGESTLSIAADDTAGADFVTWLSDTGGDYSAASATVEVVPEPASLGLMCMGALALLGFLRRRSR